MAATARNSNDSLPGAAIVLAAWVFPGLGYWLIGQRFRAIIVGLSILAIFAGGILIGGLRVVDAPSELSRDALLDKPWFIGQVLAGPVAIMSAAAARHVSPDHLSVSRSNEIGTLYTALAGMLNLLVIMDSGNRTNGHLPGGGDQKE